MLRLAFLGTPDFAVPTLAELVAQGHDIACVYSQPPRPKGRGLESEPSPVHKFALASQLAVRTPLTLKDEAQQESFRALDIEAAIVVAYGLLLPKPILDAHRAFHRRRPLCHVHARSREPRMEREFVVP